MSVLVPKKGSKEQIKLEEGRLLYAMVYGKKINLAKMIMERLKLAWGRKSSPICYGMHLMEMMAKAGVDLKCAGVDETHFNSVIDHHTLRRLGYTYQHGGWDYIGKGHKKAQAPVDEGEEEEEERGNQVEAEAAQATQPQPQAPSTSTPRPTTTPRPAPTPRPTEIPSQSTNLATKDDLTYLQQFLFEQLQLFQATLLSTLDKMDSRLKNQEEHLIFQPHPSPQHFDPTDPKGKRPIPSPPLSIHSSPSHPSSPPSHHTSHKSESSSSSSSSSSSPAPTRYKLAARKIPTTSTPHLSSDSEATHSDPHLPSPPAATPTHPPSPTPSAIPTSAPQPSSPIPPPQPPIPTSPLPTVPSSSQTYTRRRKLAVSRPPPIGPPYLLLPPPSPSP